MNRWNDLIEADAIPSMSFAYHGRNNRRLKEKFGRFYAQYFRDMPQPAGSGMRSRRRLGFVVTQSHEGIFLRCMRGIIEHLDREAFELLILCSGGIVETVRKGIHRDDLRFIPLSDSFRESVARIRDAACDVIYYWEVGSDSRNYFLPFARLAPVQCTSHGSLITTGVPAVDYFISSELVETDAAQEHYSEKLWKLCTLLMNEGRLSPVPPASRDYFGLPEKRNLYLCFQNPLKIHPDFDPLLGGILEADPIATIALLSGTRGAAAAVLKERFKETIGPQADRIVFLPWLKFQDYCCLLVLADVVLDPPHYTASSSAYDILSFSQPTVTLPGELAVGAWAAASTTRCTRRSSSPARRRNMSPRRSAWAPTAIIASLFATASAPPATPCSTTSRRFASTNASLPKPSPQKGVPESCGFGRALRDPRFQRGTLFRCIRPDTVGTGRIGGFTPHSLAQVPPPFFSGST